MGEQEARPGHGFQNSGPVGRERAYLQCGFLGARRGAAVLSARARAAEKSRAGQSAATLTATAAAQSAAAAAGSKPPPGT